MGQGWMWQDGGGRYQTGGEGRVVIVGFGASWGGMGQNGVGWDKMGWDGMRQDGMGKGRMGWGWGAQLWGQVAARAPRLGGGLPGLG